MLLPDFQEKYTVVNISTYYKDDFREAARRELNNLNLDLSVLNNGSIRLIDKTEENFKVPYSIPKNTYFDARIKLPGDENIFTVYIGTDINKNNQLFYYLIITSTFPKEEVQWGTEAL